MQNVPRVTLGKEYVIHNLHKCWVIYNNYTGRIYAKLKMKVNPIIYSFNFILAHVYVRVSSCHQPRLAKSSILIVHFYTVMSSCHSSNHKVNSDADTLPFVKNKKRHKNCSKLYCTVVRTLHLF